MNTELKNLNHFNDFDFFETQLVLAVKTTAP